MEQQKMKEPLEPSDFRCDYPNCKLVSFVEIFLGESWFYLCLPHFVWFWHHVKHHISWCLAEWITRLPLVTFIWNKYAAK